MGKEPRVAYESFYRRIPDWLLESDPATSEGVALLLRDLKGRQPTSVVAVAAARNRYAVGRWLKGETEPRLPDFFRMIEASSLRLLDFIASFVPLDAIPALAKEGQRFAAARRVALEAPWSHAVLRALELEDYRALDGHQPGWIAKRVGLSLEEEERCVQLLATAGQIIWRKGRWVAHSVSTLDLRQDAEATRQLACWCAQLGTDRLSEGGEGQFAFNVFSVSTEDAARLRELQRQYFAQLRAIISESRPAQRLLVANLQIFELGEA